MCGRYTLRNPRHPWLKDLPAEFERPRYNIAPSQTIPVVGRDREGERRVRSAIWGFRPPWLQDQRREPINARAETAATTPMFRRAFDRGRCLIPADGWYEWQTLENGRKQPYFFHRRDDALFWFAGLATRDRDERTRVAIITTAANATAGTIHDRMPLVLPDDEAAAQWIDPTTTTATLDGLLTPPSDEALEPYPVSRRVNRPDNDDPRCIAPDTTRGDGD